jgi:uncharacterized pyridoxamine 5'-phosphate oxidase family protein
MTKRDAKLKKDIWKKFKDMQVIHFATSDGKRVRVRPVTLLHINKKLWVSTGAKDAKMKQLKKNKNFEFCLTLKTKKYQGYLRGAGTVKIVRDLKTKRVISKKIPFFTQFWKEPSDPGFALLQLRVKEFEYLKPGGFLAEKIKV